MTVTPSPPLHRSSSCICTMGNLTSDKHQLFKYYKLFFWESIKRSSFFKLCNVCVYLANNVRWLNISAGYFSKTCGKWWYKDFLWKNSPNHPWVKEKKNTSKKWLDVFQVRDCETRHKPVWKGKKYIVLL